jgi:RNA recognition motif-containing protein
MFGGDEGSFANDALLGSRPFANGTPAEHPQRSQLHIWAVVFLERARADLQPSTYSMSNVMSKIYVGNLPFSADEEAVRTLFSQHGTVDSVALIMDRDTGRPRGFGFVEMPRTDAARAIQSLNGQDMGGRPLKVNEAQDKPRTGGGGQPRW